MTWLDTIRQQWPRIRMEDDDGVVHTHFSYEWEPDSAATNQAMLDDRMPEMHVWVGLPDKQIIIDLTTRFLPAQCRQTAGLEWLAPPPPDYLWCHINDLPRGVYYLAEIGAVQLACYMLSRS